MSQPKKCISNNVIEKYCDFGLGIFLKLHTKCFNHGENIKLDYILTVAVGSYVIPLTHL